MTLSQLRLFSQCLSYAKTFASLGTVSKCRPFNCDSDVCSRTIVYQHGNNRFLGALWRQMSTSNVRHSSNDESSVKSMQTSGDDDCVNITFITYDGEVVKVKGKVGDNVLDLILKHEIGSEGACKGQLACTTCHMYVEDKYIDLLNKESDQELDLLETVILLKPNSRLTCQINLTKELDGIHFSQPEEGLSYYISGAKLQKIEETPETNAEVVNVIFITHKGEEFPVKGKVGDNLLVLAQDAGLDVDGACCRQLKCTTCHMYIEDSYFDKAEEASEQELDLLDTAKFLKPNSRLTCQIHLTKELEGMRVRLPLGTVNFYVDGHKPSHH